jgi:DnaK suppressor protein
MMAAKKSAPKASKAKKPAAAKPAPKKAVPAKKPMKPAAEAPKPAAKATAAPKPAKAVVKPAAPAAKPERKSAARPTPAAPAATPPRTAPPMPKTEDNESQESLLAGPRNVQPYVAKRGEQYMGKEQLEHFRKILQSWKQDLMVEVDRTVSHMKDEAANFPDPNDRATQEEEFSLELRTRDRERKLIRKIDEALGRIEDGTYGYCIETGEQIGVKRLEARPVATLSIEAQERRERREKQYGDRDDRYR